MADKEDAILSSYMGGGICVDRGREKKMSDDDKKQQNLWIRELTKDGERTRTLIEEFRQDLGCLAKKQDKIIETLSQMASDERAARVATDMRIERLEGADTTIHVRIDGIETRVGVLESEPGKKAEKQVQTVGKKVFEYGAVGALMLLILGLKEWLKGL